MTKLTQLVRQGDVLLVPSSHPSFVRPKGQTTPKPSTVAGRHVLAYGEVTGHHHSIDASKGTLVLDEGGVTYLTIAELTAVEHQEHGAITLPPDLYMQRQQVEWGDDQEPRAVLD